MYVMYVCMKRSLRNPQNTLQNRKISWGHTPDPLTQSIVWAPLSMFALGSHNSRGGPDSVHLSVAACYSVTCCTPLHAYVYIKMTSISTNKLVVSVKLGVSLAARSNPHSSRKKFINSLLMTITTFQNSAQILYSS